MEKGNGGSGENDEGDYRGENCLGGEDDALGWGACGEGGGRIVVDDEEGDDDVLDGEEEVLAVCGEGEFVAVRVGEGNGVREGFERVCGEREATGRTGRNNCGSMFLNKRLRERR